jgi:uncharacterized protein (TIGR00730 family)
MNLQDMRNCRQKANGWSRRRPRRALPAASTSANREVPNDTGRLAQADVRVSGGRSGEGQKRVSRRPLVSVFGSSRAKAPEALYQEAYTLGRLLGEAGFDVATGGYRGVMEAVSRGAAAGGAHVVGITVANFKDEVNPFIAQEIRAADIYARLRHLLESADAYVALRGGMGTLCEVVFAWQMLKLELLRPRPLILLGQCWEPVLTQWLEHLTVTEKDCDCFTLTRTPQEAVTVLATLLAASKNAPVRP